MVGICIRPGVGDTGAEALRWAPVDIECGREKYIDGAPQGYRVPTSRMVVVCNKPGVGYMPPEALRGGTDMKVQRQKALAKINLTLDIVGKREDGYHELETIMHTVSLHDKVTLLPGEGGVGLWCNLPYVPRDSRNIAYKAALAFFQETGKKGAVYIKLQKRIPVGAGMAGGSTDAAAVLRLLNRAYGYPLTKKKLQELALTLGADVPFCLETGCRLARGIGEKLTPAPHLPPCGILVIKPRYSISTKSLFQKMDAGPLQQRPDTQAMLRALEEGDLEKIGANLRNVMEPVLREKLLAEKALGARMTGSGSALYGLFENTQQAEKAAEAFRKLPVETFVCTPVF